MNNRNNDNRNRGALASFIFLIVLLVISLIMIYTMTGRETNVNESYIYSDFQEDVTNKKVEKVVAEPAVFLLERWYFVQLLLFRPSY